MEIVDLEKSHEGFFCSVSLMGMPASMKAWRTES
jgi:hypothetical protein